MMAAPTPGLLSLPAEVLEVVLGALEAADGAAEAEVARAALRRVCPSLRARTPQGAHRLPAEVACRRVKLLKWASSENLELRIQWKVCEYAALGGHIQVLKWAKDHGCPWDSEIIAIHAARGGQRNVLEWLYIDHCLILNEDYCSVAAMNGHLDLLKELRRWDCPWNEVTCQMAARHGHVHVLKWAREHGCPTP